MANRLLRRAHKCAEEKRVRALVKEYLHAWCKTFPNWDFLEARRVKTQWGYERRFELSAQARGHREAELYHQILAQVQVIHRGQNMDFRYRTRFGWRKSHGPHMPAPISQAAWSALPQRMRRLFVPCEDGKSYGVALAPDGKSLPWWIVRRVTRTHLHELQAQLREFEDRDRFLKDKLEKQQLWHIYHKLYPSNYYDQRRYSKLNPGPRMTTELLCEMRDGEAEYFERRAHREEVMDHA